MGGQGSGRKPYKYATREEYYESVKARARDRSRKRAQMRRDGLLGLTEAEKQASRDQAKKRRELRSTAAGRAAWLAEKRTKYWAYGLRSQLKGRVRCSRKSISVDWKGLSTAWIREQFERQQGRCFYTGIPFEIVEDFRGMRRPSLDRIDSSKGYTRENTVLCLTAINYLKNDYHVGDVIQLLLDIVQLHCALFHETDF